MRSHDVWKTCPTLDYHSFSGQTAQIQGLTKRELTLTFFENAHYFKIYNHKQEKVHCPTVVNKKWIFASFF